MTDERRKEIQGALEPVFEQLRIADSGFIVIDMDGEPYYAFQIGSPRLDSGNNKRVDDFIGGMEAMKFDILYGRKKAKESTLSP